MRRDRGAGVKEILCDACGDWIGFETSHTTGLTERHRDPFDCIDHLQRRLASLEQNARVIHVPDPVDGRSR